MYMALIRSKVIINRALYTAFDMGLLKVLNVDAVLNAMNCRCVANATSSHDNETASARLNHCSTALRNQITGEDWERVSAAVDAAVVI